MDERGRVVDAEGGLEGFDKGQIRHRQRPRIVTAADDGQTSAGRHRSGQLLTQGGLANAGLARDEQQTALPVCGGRKGRQEPGKVGITADEERRLVCRGHGALGRSY